MARDLGIAWPLSSVSGYGVYGTRLALTQLKDGRGGLALFQTPIGLILNPLEEARLAPYLARAGLAEGRTDCPHPVLHGVGNEFALQEISGRVWGQPDIGCIAFEDTRFSPQAIESGKRFQRLIAISSFNADHLRALGFANVLLARQGVDGSQFHPAPRSGLLGERFAIFSGGKLEYRKGQDLVVAAFKRFQARHPEALLVTAWQTPNPAAAAAFALAGHVAGLPEKDGKGGLDLIGWLAANGVGPDSVRDLGYVAHPLMPAILREMDAALFPSRCEGGTNLVAMEAIACGVPSVVAANTGQLDLIAQAGCRALARQAPVRPPHPEAGIEGWGESDVEEIVAHLEAIHTDRAGARARALAESARIREWDWDVQNRVLLDSL
ncbi:MAG: glycosyltransferase family 4 protein [Rhodospirillales bacterium]|nr:glycosyltransferase family 4 protein [Rhodospirillales bacterium]